MHPVNRLTLRRALSAGQLLPDYADTLSSSFRTERGPAAGQDRFKPYSAGLPGGARFGGRRTQAGRSTMLKSKRCPGRLPTCRRLTPGFPTGKGLADGIAMTDHGGMREVVLGLAGRDGSLLVRLLTAFWLAAAALSSGAAESEYYASGSGGAQTQPPDYVISGGTAEVVAWADAVPTPAQVSLSETALNAAMWSPGEAGAGVSLVSGAWLFPRLTRPRLAGASILSWTAGSEDPEDGSAPSWSFGYGANDELEFISGTSPTVSFTPGPLGAPTFAVVEKGPAIAIFAPLVGRWLLPGEEMVPFMIGNDLLPCLGRSAGLTFHHSEQQILAWSVDEIITIGASRPICGDCAGSMAVDPIVIPATPLVQ